MNVLRLFKVFFTLSSLAMIASTALLIVPGPKLSIDFTGGTLLDITLPEGKTKEDVQAALGGFQTDPPLQNIGIAVTDDGVLLRMRDISNEEHTALITHVTGTLGPVTENSFTTIGPTVGDSLKQRSVIALLVASAAIILYIAIAFKNVPKKLSPWRFGVIAVVTLLHDILITTGIFVIISMYSTFEFDTLFITALLSIMGYSVNDTIVIFDRIRENLALQNRGEDFVALCARSVRETFARSVNTAVSTLIMLVTFYFLGAESIRWFILTLVIGTIIGAYSSIGLATPMLIYWKKKG